MVGEDAESWTGLASVLEQRGRTPAGLGGWWRHVREELDTPLHEIPERPDLWRSLLQICAAADEACEGVGFTEWGNDPDFYVRASDNLQFTRTLCESIHPSRAVVLPKLHTPKLGLTTNSLSHHLALCDSSEVVPIWSQVEVQEPLEHSFNMVLLPLPEEVVPRDFEEVPGGGPAGDLEGHFTFRSSWMRGRRAHVLAVARKAVDEARRLAGTVHAVVFPELALERGWARYLSSKLGVMVVAGEGEAAQSSRRPGSNDAVVATMLSNQVGVEWRQPKHHCWKLDRQQIVQYGIGAGLDPKLDWWELIAIGDRRLNIFSLSGWLNVSVLICEDLARQEPVAEIVRAVGPNLVVALLMDGPQLEKRWSARYATVLADDPGSSVLRSDCADPAEHHPLPPLPWHR